MAYIQASTDSFAEASREIRLFVDAITAKMIHVNLMVNSLRMAYGGPEYMLFVQKWDKFCDKNSDFFKLINELSRYASYFDFAASKYTEEQNNAFSRAKKFLSE